MSSIKRNILYFLLPVALSFFLLGGSVMLSKTIIRWKVLNAKVKVAKKDLGKLMAMKDTLERSQRLAARVEEFVKRATYMGLTPDRWDQYDVEITGPISFEQLVEVLGQTGAGNNYYFEPLILYLAKSQPKKQGEQNGAEEPQGPNSPGGRSTGEDGDIFLKLKGNFLVRR